MDSQTTTVELHDMAHGGEAVGRLEDGRAVFVAGGIPGETVEIRITRENDACKWVFLSRGSICWRRTGTTTGKIGIFHPRWDLFLIADAQCADGIEIFFRVDHRFEELANT